MDDDEESEQDGALLRVRGVAGHRGLRRFGRADSHISEPYGDRTRARSMRLSRPRAVFDDGCCVVVYFVVGMLC